MLVDLKYGRGVIKVEVPGRAEVAYPQELPGVTDARSEIRRAMDNPIGCKPLHQLARGKSDAAVVINDITRPTPTGPILEEILADLKMAGISEDAVTAVIACGNHRPNTEEEIKQMVGSELASRIRIINHDCEDETNLTFVGETDSGLPVWVNSVVARASLRITTGLVTPHQAAGYSGGRKSIAPGIVGIKTLSRHHSFPLRPYEPAQGWMNGNPFHIEAVKAARMVGVDFIVNVVTNSTGEVVKAVAGEMEAAHEPGVATCEESWAIKFPHKFDIVVVTPGGYPRDIDLHQSQKAMATAETVVEDDGIIVLIAECSDGIGKFGDWLKQATTPREVIKRFQREGFTREHSSKAFMCARALDKFPVIVYCSGIEQAELEQMFFRYAPSPQAAVEEALSLKGQDSRVLVLPYASSCVASVEG